MLEHRLIVSLADHSDEEKMTKVEQLADGRWGLASRGQDIWFLSGTFSDDEFPAALGKIEGIVGKNWALVDETMPLPAARQVDLDDRLVNSDSRMMFAANDTTIGDVEKILKIVLLPPEGSSSSNGGHPEKKLADPAGSTDAASTPVKAAQSETAAVLTAGLAALNVPALLSKHIPAMDAAEIAAGMYAKRLDHTDHLLPWLLAPELVLLDEAAAGSREELAEDMLRVRTGIAHHQTRLAQAQVNLADERTAVVGKAVDLLGDAHLHMVARLKMARRGPAMLLGTTIFATLAVAAVLAGVAIGKVDGLVAALLVFVLALFAASPAVLLINERPLQGLDQWMPGGKAEDDSTKAEADTPAKDDAKTP